MLSDTRRHQARDAVTSVLTKFDEDACRTGPGRWRFTVRNTRLARASARVAGDWLFVEAALPFEVTPVTSRSLRKWLAANGTLPGGVRFAVLPDLSVVTCADVLLDDEVDWEARIRGVLRGLREALHVCADSDERYARTQDDDNKRPASGSVPWIEIGQATGWSISELGDDRFSVSLDVPTGLYQAEIVETSGAWHIRAGLPTASRATEAGTAALFLFLARTNYMFRCVRACATTSDCEISSWIEASFCTPPAAPEVDSALGALSAACALTHREVLAFQHDAVARQYLRPLVEVAQPKN